MCLQLMTPRCLVYKGISIQAHHQWRFAAAPPFVLARGLGDPRNLALLPLPNMYFLTRSETTTLQPLTLCLSHFEDLWLKLEIFQELFLVKDIVSMGVHRTRWK